MASSNRALLDNSAFAGVMRLYVPDLEMHRRFLHQYPDHRIVDELSVADFLTALCLYDTILLETSSVWNDKHLRREGYEVRKDQVIGGSSASWVEQLKRLLPSHVSALMGEVTFSRDSDIDEEEAASKAFDILKSPLKSTIALLPGEKLPNVYYADDYVYRQRFADLNTAAGCPLDEHDLAQAMFLHRGLFLQSGAHANRCVYLPYHYRGRMLAQLPPMISVRAPNDGRAQARLPLAEGARPGESEYIRVLNEYYYSLLQAVTWTTYKNDVPFIGAAILASANGKVKDAIEIAMEFRSQGLLRERLAELDAAVQAGDRPRFESLMKAYRSELAAAARHFGAEIDSPQHRAFYELVIGWMPKEVGLAVKAAVQLLPEYVRHWAYEASSTLITKSPVQMLFVRHVESIRATLQYRGNPAWTT